MEFNFKRLCDLFLLLLAGCLFWLMLFPSPDSAAEFIPPSSDNSITPESFTLHLKLAQKFSEKDAFIQEAISEFELAKNQNAKSSLPYLGLARLNKRQDDWTKAVGNYRRSVERNPDLTDENTSTYLGKELIGFTKEAIRRFRRQQKEGSDDAVNKRNLKNAYFLKRKLAGGCG